MSLMAILTKLWTWAEQQLGLVMSSRAISNQILRAHKRVEAKSINAGSNPNIAPSPSQHYLATDRTLISITNTNGNVEPVLTTLTYSAAVPLIKPK